MSIFDNEIINTIPLSDVVELKLQWWGTQAELEESMIDYAGVDPFYHRYIPDQTTRHSCTAIVVNRLPIEKKIFEYCDLFLPYAKV